MKWVSERAELLEDQKGSGSGEYCRGARNQAKKGKAARLHTPFSPNFDLNLPKTPVPHQHPMHQASHQSYTRVGRSNSNPRPPVAGVLLLYINTHPSVSLSPSTPRIHLLASMPVAIVCPLVVVPSPHLTRSLPKGRASRPTTIGPRLRRESGLPHVLGFLVP